MLANYHSHCLLILGALAPFVLAVPELPPKMTKPPTINPDPMLDDIVYFDTEGKTGTELPCQALGSAPIKYSWTKNGESLDVNDPKYISNRTKISKIVLKNENQGTISLTELKEDDEGMYQCKAENKYGVSLSKKIIMKKATKRTFAEVKEKTYKPLPGTFLKMSCNPPKNDPPAQVRWVKFSGMGETQQYVELNDRIAIDLEGNLYFANVQKLDENNGEQYACESALKKLVGIKIEGAYSTIKVQKVDEPLQFPVELQYFSPTKVTALKGERVRFKCIFSGNPTPSVTWMRINGKKDDRMMELSQSFIINDIHYEDAGTYECRGNNAVTRVPVTQRFVLEVEAKPSWTAKPVAVDAGVEEGAVFECGAEGKPPPKVQWFINGKSLNDLKPDPRRVLSSGQLRFLDLSQDDAQVIQCNASNVHGYLWADVGLSILAYKPEIKVPFTYKKVAEGQTVVLPCDTDGKPNPLIYWKRGKQKMEGSRYTQHKSGNLTITNAQVNDAGFWTCFTENKYGKADVTGELVVRQKTLIKIAPAPKIQETMYNKQTQFTCSATTDQKEMKHLTISWLHNGIPVDLSNPRLILTPGKGLIINGTTSDDTGNYTCVASNGLDSDRASAVLKVFAPPDPPTDITFESCLSRSVIVSWKPGRDNFSPINKYYVEYNNSYAPYKWHRGAIVTDGQKTSAKVILSPHANYTFRVIAVNDYGESEPSNRSFTVCESNPEKPDKHPDNVRTDRSKPGVLIVKWDRMEEIEHNGDGFQYILEIKKDGKSEKYTISNWTQTSREFDKGVIFEPFKIYVTARNSEGAYHEGATLHIGYTGEAEPLTSPGNLEVVPGTIPTATSVQLQWDPVDLAPDKIRGIFTGYKVRYWKVDEKDTTTKTIKILRSPPADDRVRRAIPKEKVEIKNLPPYSDLEIDVVASNTYYDSNSSNVINVTTPEGVPGPVNSARVIQRGSTHFLIEWEKPKQENGILRGYDIAYRMIDGLRLGDLVDVVNLNDSDENRVRIEELKHDREYRVVIWAKTIKGRGESYGFDAKTANSGNNLQKPVMHIALIGEDFINVTWSVSQETDVPAGPYHYVKYRRYGELDWTLTENEKVNTWLNVSGLEPNTPYEICVVASDGEIDEASPLEQVSTRGDAEPSVNEDTSVTQTPWFIIMMVLIALLVLFLLLVCFLKRSRGEKYNVQEREKFGGTDPENPDKDLFNEYPKSGETDPLAAGSPDSFDNEPDKLPGGSETDSMAEYGDVDPSKFNEDGSFIGQYGSGKPEEKGNQPSAMSTFV